MRNIVSCFLLLTLLAACQPAAPKTDIAVVIKSTNHPYWKTFYDGLVDTVKEDHLNVYIQSLGEENRAEEQLNLCENALLHQPKALVIASVNEVNLTPCILKAQAQGIVVIDTDGNIKKDVAAEQGLHIVFSVASDNYEIGKKAAEYLQGKKGKVLVIEGLTGSAPSYLRANGFKENLSKDLHVVSSLSADWDRAKAADITNDTLTAHPNLAVVFAVNDPMALGAVEVLRGHGRNDVIVIGVDGIADAVKSVKEGGLTATVAQLPYLMAKETLKKTAAYLAHPMPQTYEQHIPILTIDKALLDKGQEPLLQYVR